MTNNYPYNSYNSVIADGDYTLTGSWYPYITGSSAIVSIGGVPVKTSLSRGNVYETGENTVNRECFYCGTVFNKHLDICSRCGGNKFCENSQTQAAKIPVKLLRLEKQELVTEIVYKLFYSNYSYENVVFENSELIKVAKYRDTKEYVLEIISRVSNTPIDNLRRTFYG